MNESILEDIRCACNLGRDDDSFDGQLIIHTNTFLFRSAQLGVGKKGFRIKGIDEKWSDFIEKEPENFAAVKDYIGLRVHLLFDPPQNASVLAEFEKLADEFEWTIYAEADVNAD